MEMDRMYMGFGGGGEEDIARKEGCDLRGGGGMHTLGVELLYVRHGTARKGHNKRHSSNMMISTIRLGLGGGQHVALVLFVTVRPS